MSTTDPTTVTEWMRDLAERGTLPPIAGFAELVGDDALHVTLEVYRKKNGSTSINAAGYRSALPQTLPFSNTWTVKKVSGAWHARREGERLTVCEDDGLALVHWERFSLPALSAATAIAQIRELPALADFAALAEGADAFLRTYGVGRDTDLGALGLVAINTDVGRFEQNQVHLRARGFAPTKVEGRWDDAEGTRSLIFMGSTFYGYVGPVPLSVGGMHPSPRSTSHRMMTLLLEARDAVAPSLTEDDLFELDRELQNCLEEHERVLTWILARAVTPRTRALCEAVRALAANL